MMQCKVPKEVDVQVFMDERARHAIPMDGVHEDHMDMDVQVLWMGVGG